tara:strand:- start:230 stop:691 length:462 start_codon:yes stop_codon:yes gene_type:complete
VFPSFTVCQVSKLGLRQLGEALIEVTIFKIDVYRASYFVGKDKFKKPVELLELIYLRDVKREHSISGWKEGFKNIDKKRYAEAIRWIFENTVSVKEKDCFSILKKSNEVSFYLNNKLIATTKNKRVLEIVHSPWIGKKPLDDEVKLKLLGKNK